MREMELFVPYTFIRVKLGALFIDAGVLAPYERQSSQEVPLHLWSHSLGE